MIRTLVEALTEAAADDSLRAVHLRGAGDHFCAGVDWVGANSRGRQRPRAGDLVRRIPHAAHRVIELVESVQLPVVCSVQGWAVGFGCNLALAADFTVAATDAVFWEPFVERGFSPDSGATWLLPRLVGLARARRMLLLGEQVSGTDAADWGLIHQAVATLGTRRHGRAAAGPTGVRADGGDRADQAGAELRPTRDTGPIVDTGAVQSGTDLSDSRFQRGTGSLPAAAPTEVPGPMTGGQEGNMDAY